MLELRLLRGFNKRDCGTSHRIVRFFLTTLFTALLLMGSGAVFFQRADAMTILPPRDLAELASTSDAVVLARARTSRSVRQGSLLFTITEMVVVESVDGALPSGKTIQVRCPGGQLSTESWTVPGSPRLAEGRSYFLCLDRRTDDEELWIPATMAYGVLVETTLKSGETILTPIPESHDAHPLHGANDFEPIGSYARFDMIDHLKSVLSGSATWNGRLLLVEADSDGAHDHADGGALKGVPSGCAYIPVSGRNTRWQTFDSGGVAPIFATAGGDFSIDGGGFRELAEATVAWMNVSGTNINPLFEGMVSPTFSCSGAAPGNIVYFNDPCNDIAALQNGCRGVLALGGPFQTDGAHVFDGENWTTITNWVVVVNDGTGCLGSSNYRIMLTHELGHGLGFGHVVDTNALMFESCCNNINFTDETCSRFTYPRIDPDNARPTVIAGRDLRISLASNTLRLQGTVTDDGLPANGSIETRWRWLAGLADVTIADPTALETDVEFFVPGTYLFGLSAHDGELLAADFIEITVDTFALRNTRRTFANGENGYSGTRDTYLWAQDPTVSFNTESDLFVDTESPANSGFQKHTLLRFEDIFGPGDDKVPAGSPIASARLELSTVDIGDGAFLHRMLEPWSTDDSWSTYEPTGILPGVQAFADFDSEVSGTSSIGSADVTPSLRAWSEDPCSTFGWALLPRGSNGWGVSSSRGTSPPRLIVQFSPFVETTLVASGDKWEYLRGNETLPADWADVDFEIDNRWLSGPTGIGYGDGDDATVLGDMRGSYTSIFCRREFELATPEASAQLILRVDYDDGFVAYLNGVEVARSTSMSAAGPSPDSTTTSASRESGSFEEFAVDASLLRAGTNVLAIQVHNVDISSSDLSFIPELIYNPFLIGPGDAWRFLRGSEGMPTDWQSNDFEDAAWELGPAGFGYGGGDDATVLEDMLGNYVAVLFRKTFDLNAPEDLLLGMIHDDGVVVHVNGSEIGRVNMPDGPIDENTLASPGVETALTTMVIPSSALRSGTNVLAVSVHNVIIKSDDLSFHAVVGRQDTPPPPDPCQPDFRRGDVNGDTELDITDPLRLLTFLFGSGEPVSCQDAADIDDNSLLDITDAFVILRFLFLGFQPATPLDGQCSRDRTPDSLPACENTGCETEE